MFCLSLYRKDRRRIQLNLNLCAYPKGQSGIFLSCSVSAGVGTSQRVTDYFVNEMRRKMKVSIPNGVVMLIKQYCISGEIKATTKEGNMDPNVPTIHHRELLNLS